MTFRPFGDISFDDRGAVLGNRWMPYAAGLAAALALAGCGVGTAEPAPPATTAVKSAPVSRSATASSPPAATVGPNFPAGLPDAAKKRTDDGAKAFVQHFIDELNAAWRGPDPGRIARLCLPDRSKSCAAYVKTATNLESQGHRYVDDAVSIDRLHALADVDGQTRFDVQGHQERADVVDATGKLVLTDPREPSHFVVFLEWTKSGWLVSDVKPVAS